MSIYNQILKQYWGYTQFRPLQEDIIKSVSSGKDTLGLMPTGGGKSITFQVPTMAMEGVCLVITPLIALMKDQIDNLKQRGIKALAVYSGMSHKEILITLDNAIMGDYKFLYVSPERLGTTLFQQKLKDMNVCLLAVDESHCISQWGYDFRPSYMNISDIREVLPNVPVLALTATATSEVVDDIQRILHFKEKNVFKKSFHRDNLSYIVRHSENKIEHLIQILKKVQGTVIIYVRSRLKTKEIAEELIEHGFSADYYHAGLSHEEKTLKQNAWKNNNCRIIVSTNAFGMGIDKHDVRLVVHIDLPNSIEEYYQEAGRAGRDEKKSYAVVLYNKTDSTKLKKRIVNEFPERELILQVYESLAYFFQVAEGFGAGMVYDFDLYRFCSIYKLPILPTHGALRLLELAGYIEYSDEVNNQSRLIFAIYRNDLYKTSFNKDLEQLVNVILRLYTGLFADYVYINESNIAIHIGRSRKEVYEMLKYLSKRQIVDYIPYKKTPFISYSQARIPSKHVKISKEIYEIRKKRFEKRIEGITQYVESRDVCRSRLLLTYFGETNSKDCNQCDICLSKAKKKIDNDSFKRIDVSIQKLLSKKAYKIEDLIAILSDKYSSDEVIDIIRFQLSQQVYRIEDDLLIISINE